MIPVSEVGGDTRLTSGAGAAAIALARFPLGGRPLVLHDAAVEFAEARFPARTIEIAVDAARIDDLLVPDVAATARDATAVVGLGGGSTLDVAKIVRVLRESPHLAALLHSHGERSGFVRVPDVSVARRDRVPLLAIPTTFGTGAEVSRVACLATPWGRRLLSGGRLQPDRAALDPLRTSSLPRRLQREGLLEVVLRVLGPAIGSPAALAADHDAAAIVAAAVRLGERLRVGFLGPDERLFAAQLSSASLRTWALVGRETYAAKHWYLANELSWVTGTRKIPATIAILPALWRRITEGESTWGSAERLAEAWSWVRTAVPELSSDASDGLRELIGRWGLRPIPAPTEALLRAATTRAHTSWGGSLPALARIRPEDIHRIFTESFAERANADIERGEGVMQR
ncbi:MAG: iron-containing alcohol dehydrogenase [Microbacterium sp.]|nr:iron-containing alcohol dehydrogenase [Microbacterium sp.]